MTLTCRAAVLHQSGTPLSVVREVHAFLCALAESDPVAWQPVIEVAAGDPLQDVPAGVRERVGCYDPDSPGGCG